MSKLKIFENPAFGQMRTVVIDNEPWFVATDVCKCLEIGNSRQTLTRLDDDEKDVISNDTPGGRQNMSVVNEPGLYTLVLSSRKPEAKAFKRWITHEVIPAIRKHGLYAADELLNNPDFAIAAFTALKEEREKNRVLESTVQEKTKQIDVMQPKADYYDRILQCSNAIPVSVIAKDYGMSAQSFNKLLHSMHIQYRLGNKEDEPWLLYAEYQGKGYTRSATYFCGNKCNVNTRWTQKGRLFLYEKLKERGILPEAA